MPRIYRKYDLSDYIITKSGDVINKHNGHKVKPQPNAKGYLRFGVGGKQLFVHRVVATLYIPNPDNLPQVNHKDGNKLNNSVENLEWVTNQQNRDHAIKKHLHLMGEKCSWSKLKYSQVDFIRKHPEITNKEYADLFGVTVSTIASVKRGKSWKD